MKWLNLNTLDSVQPDAKIFQGFNATLRGDFQKEAELFLSSILLEDKSVLDLLTSDQTFMNNRLARHYGIQNGPGTSAFKQVTLTDPNRFGSAGQGRGADAHFLWRPHLPGAPRGVGAGQD